MQHDDFNLARFVEAQADIYPYVIQELQLGKKFRHWMWFIFPQIIGLSQSETGQFYAIRSVGEAVAYLHHPLLSQRLTECCKMLLIHQDKSAQQIFGALDAAKLCSSMTLFLWAAEHNRHPIAPLLNQVLMQYFEGKADAKTLSMLKS